MIEIMNNLKKLNEAFINAFEVKESQLGELTNCNTDNWDSVGHMTLITYLEDGFGLIIEPEDIMDFISYKAAKTILSTKYNIEFIDV